MTASRLISSGSGNHIDYARPSGVDNSNPWSIALWAKKTGAPSLEALISLGTGSAGILIVDFWSSGNGMLAQRGSSVSSANATQLSASTTVTIWHHYAFTWDGSAARIKIYVDGVDTSANGTAGLTPQTTSGILVGSDSIFTTAVTVSQLEVYERELTADDVTQIFYRPGTLGDAAIHSPIWGVDSPEVDISGNGRTGTITGTAAADDDGPPYSMGYGPIVGISADIVAGGAARPQGPLGHPLYGALAGPIGP